MSQFYKPQIFMKTFALICMMIGLGTLNAQQAENGTLIIAKIEGQVKFYKADGAELPANAYGEGDILPIGVSAETGQGASMLGILSNGTLMTMREKTRMKIGEFKQTPFDPGNQKLSDLQEEPSTSDVTIDLDVGSLIIKTKKLNKRSNLDINSPVGVAGIRGTEFQMAMDPQSGVQLDVTESVVAFTPPGATQAIPVSMGNGLSVSPAGVAVPRPINPVVAQQITAINQAAVQATENVSLDAVAAPAQEGGEQGEDAKGDGEDSDSEGDDDGGDGDSDGGDDGGDSDSGDDGGGAESDSGSTDAGGGGSDSSMQSAVLENNTDIQQIRKTGEVSENSKALSKFGLSVSQTKRFHSLSDSAQTKILGESRMVVHRVLSMDGFLKEEADIFYTYAATTRVQILGLEDATMIALLRQQVDEELLIESLTALNLDLSMTSMVPEAVEASPIDIRASQLSDKLREAGNEEVMEDLLERGGGVLTEALLQEGEVADSILRDYELGVTDPAMQLTLNDVLDNPFYEELAALYRELELDMLVAGQGSVYTGRNLIVSDNAQALVPYFGNGAQTMVISASQELSLENDLDLSALLPAGSSVVVMAGENLNIRPGITINMNAQNLVVAARQDITINNVNLDAKDEVAVRSLRDAHIDNVEVGADSLASLKARRDLNVDGLTFKRDVSRIVMEATTIRLKNINFPAASQVHLNSLKGAIDGKYPNFGTAIPAADQVGRVNFIQNISVGGNAVMSRPAFDQFGTNIQIGKIARP